MSLVFPIVQLKMSFVFQDCATKNVLYFRIVQLRMSLVFQDSATKNVSCI